MTTEQAIKIGWRGTEAREFAEWMTDVDRTITQITGLSYLDLPDWNYAEAFRGGMDSLDAAEEVLLEAGFDF